MPRFRPTSPLAGPPAPLAVAQAIDAVMQPGHFFVAAPLALTWDPARTETTPWEVFRGRLLDTGQTREQRTFLTWHVRDASGEPLLSVRFDVPGRAVHVTRGVLCHVWEGYDAGGGVIESREAPRWTRELVGTVALADVADLGELHDELISLVWQAVVGTSRLPLHAVEAPLPAFLLGQLAYVYRPDLPDDAPPMTAWSQLVEHGLQPGLNPGEAVKLLEAALRHVGPADVPALAAGFVRRWRDAGHAAAELPALLRRLFNDVSLSPYTGFADTALAWAAELTRRGDLDADAHLDFLAHLLRQLGRHLTAYDLVTFHHRGANYPDALLLDAALTQLLGLAAERPDRFAGPAARLRRRALRQACLLRRHYEGHAVPDAPTSPGENARVMPAAHPRVPDEQLLHPHRRRRKLFAGDPLAARLTGPVRELFRQSLLDLADPAEQAELGMALFIDRPLGFPKPPAEPDATPLLAHEAYSPAIAHHRRRALEALAREVGLDVTLPALAPVQGLPLTELADSPRPVASLLDARRGADDFIAVRTRPGGLRALWDLFDRTPLEARVGRALPAASFRLAVQARGADGAPVLALYDEGLNCMLELAVDDSAGYVRRAGVEIPRAGLRVLAYWEGGTRHDLRAENITFQAPG